MLKTKKRNTQKEWLQAYKEAYLYPDYPRAEMLIEKAIKRIPTEKKMIYGWSGGKDTLTLQIVLEKAGLDIPCALGIMGWQWLYPSFAQYIKNNIPNNSFIYDLDLNDEFFNEHPNLCFPKQYKDNYYWYRKINQDSYYKLAKELNADCILVGHRTADGNICNSEKNGKSYPIADFTHEDVFCILACNNIHLPDIYFQKDGFVKGTHEWIRRYTKTGIEDVYEIDKTLLHKHRGIKKIDDFLKGKGE